MSLKGASWQSSLSNLRSLLRKVNHAPRENLLQIPGLGRSKVDKILEKRGSCGEGRMSVGDLVAVPGLGVGLLAKLSGGGDPLIPTLLKYIVYYQEVLQLSRVKHPRDVVSIDLGVHNSACAHIDADLRLHSWKTLSLRMPKPYSPERCYNEVLRSLEELPEAEVYIMEVMSQRPLMHKGGFLNISVQLKSLEAMFYAILRTMKDVPVLTILPRMTSQYFDISTPRSRAKKKAAVGLVRNLISSELTAEDSGYRIETPLGNRVYCPEELVWCFDGEKKKDDLSDCLLQAVGFMEWSQMAKGLI